MQGSWRPAARRAALAVINVLRKPRSALRSRGGLLPELSAPAVAAGLSLLFAMAPGADAQQKMDTSFVYLTANPVPLIIHLDSVGVYAPAAPSLDWVREHGQALGVESVRPMGHGLFVAGLGSSRTRSELATLARQYVGAGQPQLRAAGLIVRVPGARVPMIVTDQFIVDFLPQVTREQVDSLNAVHGVQVITKLGLLDNDYLLRATPGSDGDALYLANLYHGDPRVRFSHPNLLQQDQTAASLPPPQSRPRSPLKEPTDANIHVPTPDTRRPARRAGCTVAGFEPNDHFFCSQWHLDNRGTVNADIDAPEAWAITQGSPDVVIAIIEPDGFDTLNADIRANLWVNAGENPPDGSDDPGDPWGKADDVNGWNFDGCEGTTIVAQQADSCGSNDLTDPETLYTDNWHGTAVAGVAAARGKNTVGVSGVCPICQLMLIRKEPGEVGTATAIRYAVDMGANVINLSFYRRRTQTLDEQLAVATLKNVVVVASAPDDGDFLNHSCALDLYGGTDVIAVGGSNNLDQRVSWSGVGDCLDVLAPGWMDNTTAQVPGTGAYASHPAANVTGIVTTDQVGDSGSNNLDRASIGCGLPEPPPPDRDYTMCFSGTSAAAPIVSGVIGLMKSLKPILSVSEITEILHKTADKVDAAGASYDAVTGQSLTHGYGRVNAKCALRWIQGSTNCAPVADTVPKKHTTDTSKPTPGKRVPVLVEVGVRAGLTIEGGGAADRTVLSVPGGGPRARPVMYADWFVAPSLMLEGQVGFSRTVYSESTPTETHLGGVLQLAYLFGGPYVAIQAAVDHHNIGGTVTTDWSYGGAAGYRYMPTSFLAVRLEALYRHWPTMSPHELGLAIGAGVVF